MSPTVSLNRFKTWKTESTEFLPQISLRRQPAATAEAKSWGEQQVIRWTLTKELQNTKEPLRYVPFQQVAQ